MTLQKKSVPTATAVVTAALHHLTPKTKTTVQQIRASLLYSKHLLRASRRKDKLLTRASPKQGELQVELQGEHDVEKYIRTNSDAVIVSKNENVVRGLTAINVTLRISLNSGRS
jgi:hypothetical protein